MHLQVIVGSVRKGRVCPKIAAWAHQIVNSHQGYTSEIVDLADYNLPMDIEDKMPHFGKYDAQPTVTWSEKVKKAHGYVFVFPQYNWGYPAVVKNAVDALYKEWNNKPAVIVSYGRHGGGKGADQFRQVLTGLQMKLPSANVEVKTQLKAKDGVVVDTKVDFDEYTNVLRELLDEISSQSAP